MKKIIQPSVLVATSLFMLSACSNHTPAPVSYLNKNYSLLERGSFHGSHYTVNKGDTLYFISYMTGKNVQDLINVNKLRPPYTIYPGQRLSIPAVDIRPVPPAKVSIASTVTKPKITPNKTIVKEKPKPVVEKPKNKELDKIKAKEYAEKATVNNSATKAIKADVPVSRWSWPTKGKLIAGFSSASNGNKGIDIAASRGTVITASAPGKVVYAGNALRGYGNLIIIKHSGDYLSAYAHNESILVKEQQVVKIGQKIALMGSTGADSVRLHFEIRYKGKSVDPMRYLPK